MVRDFNFVKALGFLAVLIGNAAASLAAGPPGAPLGNPPPPPPPPLWQITSPAQGGQFPHVAQLACSGTAGSNGTTWILEVIPRYATKVTLSGSSSNDLWSGTAVPLSGSWPKGSATAVLKIGGNTEDTKSFSFH